MALRFVTKPKCLPGDMVDLYFNRISLLLIDRCLNTQEVCKTSLDLEEQGQLSVRERYQVIKNIRDFMSKFQEQFTSDVLKMTKSSCNQLYDSIVNLTDRIAHSVDCDNF